jgi:ABC-type transport system involved in cytochrome c biogenesis permease subunit
MPGLRLFVWERFGIFGLSVWLKEDIKKVMDINFTIQHLLIYQTMMMYLLAFTIYKLRHRKAAWFVYTLGFAVSLISGVYRGFSVGHFPLQNLFEVFLFLGMMVFPLSVVCRKLLKVEGESVDMILGIIVLFPAGFVFNSAAQNLSPSLQSPLFVPHVAVYMLAYIIMAKASGGSWADYESE